MIRRARFFACLSLLSLVIFSLLNLQCTSKVVAQSEAEASSDPSRRNLLNQLAQVDSFLVVYDENSQQPFQEILTDMRLEIRRGEMIPVSIMQAKDVQLADLHRFPSLLIGNWSSHVLVQQIKQFLPFTFQDQGLEAAGKHFAGSEMVFKLFPFPHPQNQQMPLFLLTGNDDKSILKHLQEHKNNGWRELLWRSWGYELYNEGEAQLLGYLSDEDWQMDKRVHYDFYQTKDTLGQSPHFTFINQNTAIEASRIEEIKTACEAQYNSILKFLGKPDPKLQLSYHIYPTSERIGLQMKDTHEAQIKLETQEVHVVESPWFGGADQHMENYFLLREILGKPAAWPIEQGLVTYLNEDWFDHGFRYWATKLEQADFLPPLGSLGDEQWWKESSDLMRAITGAALVDFLIDKWGKEKFLSSYPNLELSQLANEDWEAEWSTFRSTQYTQSTQRQANAAFDFQKGFNFAHEGYRIYNGYGSALAHQSLQRLQDLNSNAIALVPYSYMRDPNIPSHIPIVEGPGMENDESTVFSHYHAKELGMNTLLKPQIWLGRSWPGDVSFDSEEKWETFFDYYGRWMIHYALLAEMHEMDMLCIGVEFVKATIAQPERWIKLIQSIRAVYSGPITYAANWGEEFEQLSFWEELDYIGLNCYYPLGDKEKVSKKELNKAFKSVIKKAEGISKASNRPLLLTEIGFRSIEGPWMNPHAQAEGRAFNEEHQEWCYETVFQTISDKDWIRGIYWWKWPSYLDYRGRENTGFTPNRKKAEAIVQAYFKSL